MQNIRISSRIKQPMATRIFGNAGAFVTPTRECRQPERYRKLGKGWAWGGRKGHARALQWRNQDGIEPLPIRGHADPFPVLGGLVSDLQITKGLTDNGGACKAALGG